MLHLWKGILAKLSKIINYRKVIDHCHFMGKYIDKAHSILNLRFN